MSLYGALFGGVSGLKAQSSKIGVISDNIANVNTVGYKQSQALFETLVVNSSTTVLYQTGGVRGESRINVDKQGLLLTTEAPTDLAISGNGFFVVSKNSDGSGLPYYTRAGSFRQDSLGNFYNAQGFFLQGWPLDREGRLPGEAGNLNTTSFANLDSLETVNVESASGVAQATTVVEVGANLNASEDVYPGEAGNITMDQNNALNFGIDAQTIILPDEAGSPNNYGFAAANSIVRGDRFTVVTGNGLNYEYEYGGFTVGRNVTTGNAGDAFADNSRVFNNTAATDAIALSDGSTLRLNIPNHRLITGDTITLSGFAAIGATPAGSINTTHTVTWVNANTVDITLAPPHGLAVNTNSAVAATTSVDYDNFAGNLFDASSATQAFFGTSGTSRFTTAALNFTITRGSGDTHTFTYRASSPNAIAGQFNNLNNLADAIDEVNGLTARVANGRLIVSAEDANESLTFANGDSTSSTATQSGIDWVTELDLATVATGSRRFNTMDGLADIVNADDGVTAVIENALSNATMQIRVDDPLDTITFADLGATPFTVPAGGGFGIPVAAAAGVDVDVQIDLTVDPAVSYNMAVGDFVVIQNSALALAGFPPVFANGMNTPGAVPLEVVSVNVPANSFTVRIPGSFNTAGVGVVAPVAGDSTAAVSIIGRGNQGSLVSELGLTTSLNSATYAPQTTGALGPQYDSSGVIGDNMASGNITAQFSRNVRIYDALGSGHDLRLSYIKIDENKWAVEVHAIPETDVSSALPNGQVAVGTIQFNGDGSLRSVSSGLTNAINIIWTNGAVPSSITIDWGTAGQPFGTEGADVIGGTDGLSQFDSDYNVAFINQNGAPVGELISVTIDADGFVIASYSNGETQNLYKLPLADFTNPNGLKAVSGNVFSETRESGTVNLREAGTNGTGEFVSAALEQSNVELSEQLTDMIVAQRAYQANTRVISTTDDLLDRLTQL